MPVAPVHSLGSSARSLKAKPKQQPSRSVVSTSDYMRICDKCGALLDDTDTFCENCGKPVDIEVEDSAEHPIIIEKEREVIREIVKVKCGYCGKLRDQSDTKCPHCGA